MKKIILAVVSVLTFSIGLLSFSGVAMANDGITPANEGVCDPLMDATKGLYGLCVAYCEAQDLDTIDKKPPSIKILDNYNKKKQAGDPDMPCVQTSCPCWTDAELASITNDGSAAACMRSTGITQIINDSLATHYATGDTARNQCAYVDLNISPSVRILGLPTTPAQSALCQAEVESACTLVGKGSN